MRRNRFLCLLNSGRNVSRLLKVTVCLDERRDAHGKNIGPV